MLLNRRGIDEKVQSEFTEAKMRIRLVLASLIFLAVAVISYPAQNYWIKHFGGLNHDNAHVHPAPDGGFIAWGQSAVVSGWRIGDIFVAKLNSHGMIEWQWIYGGAGNEGSVDLKPTTDGGFFLTGITESFVDDRGDILVLKLTSTGEIAWQHTFGGAGYDVPNDVLETEDGGYLISARTESFRSHPMRLWMIKLTSSGDIEWQRLYGKDTDAHALIQARDGGYILAGEVWSLSPTNRSDVWIVKVSKTGEIEWERAYGSPLSERAWDIQPTADGGYIVAAENWQTVFPRKIISDIWVLKLTEEGKIEWQGIYGGEDEEEAYNIHQVSDGGYILAGMTRTFGRGKSDALILKLLPTGEIEWQKTYGDFDSDLGSAIYELSTGDLLVSGTFTPPFIGEITDALIMKLDTSGDVGSGCDLISTPSLTVSDTNIEPIILVSPTEETNVVPMPTDLAPRSLDFTVVTLCGTYQKKGTYKR